MDYKFSKYFIKNYTPDSDEEYFVQVDAQYPERLRDRGNEEKDILQIFIFVPSNRNL